MKRASWIAAATIVAGALTATPAYADPDIRQMTSDDGFCSSKTHRYTRTHRLYQDTYEFGAVKVGVLAHPGTGPAVGGVRGGKFHALRPGTGLTFHAVSASIWSGVWFTSPNEADGVAERAPFERDSKGHFKWPLPGAPKFSLIGVLRDPATGRALTDINRRGIRNGAFSIGWDRGCVVMPDFPVAVTVMSNDENRTDGFETFEVYAGEWRRR
jgi:hypothetical protein